MQAAGITPDFCRFAGFIEHLNVQTVLPAQQRRFNGFSQTGIFGARHPKTVLHHIEHQNGGFVCFAFFLAWLFLARLSGTAFYPAGMNA